MSLSLGVPLQLMPSYIRLVRTSHVSVVIAIVSVVARVLRPSVNQYDVSSLQVSLPCSFAGFFKDSTWRPTGDEQVDWFVPCDYACDYVDEVHTRSQRRNRNRNRKKKNP